MGTCINMTYLGRVNMVPGREVLSYKCEESINK